ncbi:hypothetical protein GCM10010193_26500 [Kitasatospora atroaurantiaca]
MARCESALRERRGGERKQAAGAGPDQELVFTDQFLVTVVYLRLQLPHAALAELYGVTRPTVTRAIHEIRPLLAARGFAVPGRPGVRLRTLAPAARSPPTAAARPAAAAPCRGNDPNTSPTNSANSPRSRFTSPNFTPRRCPPKRKNRPK